MKKIILTSRLKELREEKNVSQDDIAEHIGLSRQAYSYYETGDRQPPLETLVKIAEYHDVTIDYLLGMSDAKLGFGYPKNSNQKK